MFARKSKQILLTLFAFAFWGTLPATVHAADPAVETPPSASASAPALSHPRALPADKKAMAEEYKKLRIEREKLSIERSQLNIRCLEAKDADKKDCADKRRALREKMEPISDKLRAMREKSRAERPASGDNKGKDAHIAKP